MNGPSEFDRSEGVRGTEGTENLYMMKLFADMMKNDTEKFHIMPDLSKCIENYDGEIEKRPTAAKVWFEKLISVGLSSKYIVQGLLTKNHKGVDRSLHDIVEFTRVNENVIKTIRKSTTEKKIEGEKGVPSKAKRTCYTCGEKGYCKSEFKNKEVKEVLEGDVKNVKVKEVASKIENLYRPVMVNGVSLNGVVDNGSSMCSIKKVLLDMKSGQ
ncbi:hypothetical protein ILUMI_14412 [Ignelater luminosus]|uniref:Uncharacterized protein n=1 Tax=Ignelater luminosus TaxID=2038154 RepID=A0A8K0CUY5_IGNLU|nr:hypothetical protein ILUMI_14412 [Ignelater luminosus]